jgi:threonine synthase
MQRNSYNAWYQCFEGCGGEYPLDEIIYHCPKCGSLLEVQQDLDLLKKKSSAEWKALFAQRYQKATGPYSSGVWDKHEWVMPTLATDNIVTIGEGRSVLFDAHKLAKVSGVGQVWVKLCGNSHTGSFKDLGMTVLVSMVNQIMKKGAKIKAVACASTGDTSAALASYCAASDIPALVMLPKDKISMAQSIQPTANGVLTFSLDTDFDGCMSIIKELTESREIYLANSMNSLRVEGQKTVSYEILQQLDWRVPDWVIVPGGNLGNISAISKGFWEMREVGLVDRLPRLVCAQSEKANPLYLSYLKEFMSFEPKHAEPTLASAIQIGNPVSIKKAIHALRATNGMVEQATEDELANASALADKGGLFVCPQTGVAIAAFLKLAERGEIKPADEVVIISTAHGLKFVDFKVHYHAKELQGVESRYANPPFLLPADIAQVRKTLDEIIWANREERL